MKCRHCTKPIYEIADMYYDGPGYVHAEVPEIFHPAELDLRIANEEDQ